MKYHTRVTRLVDACQDGDLIKLDKILNSKSSSSHAHIASRGKDFSLEDTGRALRAACMRGHHLIVDRLLKDTRFVPSDNPRWHCNDLSLAYNEGHVKVVERLLQDYRVVLSKIPEVARMCLRCATGQNHTHIINKLITDPYFDRFLDSDKESTSATSGTLDRQSGSLTDIIHFAAYYLHSGRTPKIPCGPSALDTLLKDVRILFTYNDDGRHYTAHNFIVKAKSDWYKKQAIDMQELHDELVATIACRERV